jgi:hypothetical protein
VKVHGVVPTVTKHSQYTCRSNATTKMFEKKMKCQ